MEKTNTANNANNYCAIINPSTSNLSVIYKSLFIGLLTGAIVAAFRLVLTFAEEWSWRFYDALWGHPGLIILAFLVLGMIGYGVGVLVSRYPMISGSGIPQVNGLIRGYFHYNWFSNLLAKFFGGALAIMSGLSLGREGPSIQMGACVAQGIGNRLAASRTEKKVLVASGAGAGLAAAFNAPLAGVVFTIEEIFKYFSPVILVSVMIAAIAADFVAKAVFGMSPIFSFQIDSTLPLINYWLLFLLGIILGAAGAGYNYILIFTQKLYQKIHIVDKFDIKIRLMIPFLLAGAIGLLFPLALGSGHHIIGELQPTTSFKFLLLLLAVKFIFSMASFGSGSPGGIFAPLLIIGAIIGTIYGRLAVLATGINPDLFQNFIVLAMAGYFTAIVRAPITGIILLAEMTGSLSHLLPLTTVSIIAYLTADLLKSKPIYDSLLENMIKGRKTPEEEEAENSKITIEMIVHHGSKAENKKVSEIELPSNCLLIALRRQGVDIIPHGSTRIKAQDYMIILTGVNEESEVGEALRSITNSNADFIPE